MRDFFNYVVAAIVIFAIIVLFNKVFDIKETLSAAIELSEKRIEGAQQP